MGKNAPTIEETIGDFLMKCGCSPHMRGFRALQCAIALCLDDADLIHSCCKELYPAVARILGCSAESAERNMRTCIQRASDFVPEIANIIGIPSDARKGTYTVSSFVAAAAFRMKRDLQI